MEVCREIMVDNTTVGVCRIEAQVVLNGWPIVTTECFWTSRSGASLIGDYGEFLVPAFAFVLICNACSSSRVAGAVVVKSVGSLCC
jgi:hypothetical protein